MSESRLAIARGALALGVAATLALAPGAASAQSSLELRARADSAQRRAALLREEYRRVIAQDAPVADRTLSFDGLTLRYRGIDLGSADSARVVEGVTRGLARLRAGAGAALPALLDTAAWSLDVRRRGLFGGSDLYVRDGRTNWRHAVAHPIQAADVEAGLLTRAGDRLVERTEQLRDRMGWFALRPDEAPWGEVARRLATSWAAAGRTCAAGALASCRLVLERYRPTEAVTRYFEPRDFRDVVASGASNATDSLFYASKARCLAGADSACARIVREVAPADPFGGAVRGTLLAHAIEIGGDAALARLVERRPADAGLEAIPLLAAAAGVSEDSLIASWHRRTFAALEPASGAGVPLVLSTVAWSGLLFVASRRRRYL